MRHQAFTALGMLFISLFLTACGGGGGSGGGGGGGGQSTSHNAGLDCLSSSCHGSGGTAPTFSAAGTIFSSGSAVQTAATVKFYVPNSNTLITQAETDGSGNFYTTTDLSSYFTNAGIHVTVTGPSGAITDMSNVAISGACNGSGCHASGNRVVSN